MPDPPEPAHFELALDAWVLSRYPDVAAALREPALSQDKARGAANKSSLRPGVLAALSPSKLDQCQREMEHLAGDLITRLPAGRPIDLVSQVIRPWTLAIAILVLGLGPSEERRLVRLARDRCDDEHGPVRTLRRKWANAEFERLFRGRDIEKSTFIGVSETLPAFLANAWLVLLRHPVEFARLRARPELMPKATEELLRYAGLVHSLTRFATAQIDLAGVRIAKGDRVILRLASANRDPEQIPDPGRLDLGRRPSGHIALGAGPHSCPGMTLLRMAVAAATSAFLERSKEAEIVSDVEWRRGSTLVSPKRLMVVLGAMEGGTLSRAEPPGSAVR